MQADRHRAEFGPGGRCRGTVITAGVAAGSEESVALVAAITFVTGILFLLLALFRMGWISQFLSKAVITGFLFGAAIEVVIGELPKITGTSIEGSNAWQKLFSWLQSLSETDLTTLVVGIIRRWPCPVCSSSLTTGR